ncbi:MAG: CTP synthase, partial [Chloroflexia bacterium]|nr:CTP synthase [Chloroflexia bacterium]
ELQDSYKSIAESFVHAGAANDTKVKIKWVDAEKIEKEPIENFLKDVDGVLIAPGFGHRGVEGKILAAQYARENKIPFLGICLGMQCAVIEFARNILKFENANSTEMIPNTAYPVIDLMEEQKSITDMGGTMRLGAYPCTIKKGSHVEKAYGTRNIHERHRHRYEFNSQYLEEFEKNGMIATGINPDTELVEIVEIPEHPWFVGVQFHPEYKSTVINPHPLFVNFVKAVLENKKVK